MCDQLSTFAVNKYVHLKEFLDLENCAQLTAELKKLVEEGKTQKDAQCPLSEAIHGAPVFDSLLEQLTPHFETASGKRLYPTYAYARLYAPGDELKIHTDRPACEISATLTLGFEGTPWAIYMADYCEKGSGREVQDSAGDTKYICNESEIIMNVGDAVLYRGMDKVHWRNKFEGKWQAQVFLHYVDADGPHASWKYDRRQCLSHHNQEQFVDMAYWVLEDALTKEACQKIIEGCNAAPQEKAGIGMGQAGTVNLDIRDVNRVSLPVHKGIGATLTGIALAANANAWQFNVTHSNQSEFLRYDKDGHYTAHIDTFITKPTQDCRKLTALVFLNDEFEGGRFYIQDGHEKKYPPQKAGTVVVFPSFLLHGVENVISGVRYSLVTWVVGPSFR